jgi:hypothetical protein
MESKMEHEIAAILAGASDMTIATIRPDGYPQATTVSYVTHGMTIYFGAAADSQKARNIAGCDKISLTVNLPYKTWDEIRGISLGGRAARVTDPDEIVRVGDLMLHKFPQVADYAAEGREGISLFRISPDAISLLDYRKGFGHTEYVTM